MEDLGLDVHDPNRHADRAAELQPTFESHCRRAGVPRIRVHDIRHTCASLLAALDVHPLWPCASCATRRSISMTVDIYTQIPSPETRKPLDRLNQSLDRSSET